MPITVSNFVALEETVTADFPNSPYSYSPGSGVQSVLVFVGTTSGSSPVPTWNGTPMTLLHRTNWLDITTTGLSFTPDNTSVYYVETTSTASATIAITGKGTAGSYLSAWTLNSTIVGVEDYYRHATPYLGTLPDGSPVTLSVDVPHTNNDLILNIGHARGNSGMSGTTLDAWSVLTKGVIKYVATSSAGTTTQSCPADTNQRIRGFTVLKLSGTAADGLHIDSHPHAEAKYRVDQGSTSRTHTFSGKYWGSPTAIQVRVLADDDDSTVVDWTTVDASPTGGTWSGTLSVPLGGGYYTEARFSNNTSITTQDRSRWYVGVMVCVYGQSNAESFRNTPPSNTPTYEPAVGYVTGESDDQNLSHTQRWGRGIYPVIWQDFGIPILYSVDGQAGTGIEGLRSPSSPWGGLTNALDRWGCDFFVWQHGMNDMATGTSEASYETSLSGLHQDVVNQISLTKADVPMIIGSPNRSYAGYTAANVHNIRKAQWDYAQSLASVQYSHSALDALLGDSLHFGTTPAPGQLEIAGRYGITIAKLLGVASHTAEFYIDTANAVKTSNTTIDVPVLHRYGTDFTPTSGIEGFEVSFDGGSSWSAATAARKDASTITLTHTSNAADPVKVRYLYGEDPNGDTNNAVTTMVRDNSTYQLPLMFTLEPFDAPGPSGPTVDSATVNSAGTSLTLVFSESVTTDYTGFDVDGWTLSGGSGSGTDTIVFTISQVYSGESPALDYVSATGNVTGVTSGEPLGDLTDDPISNGSGVSPNPTVSNGAASNVSFTTATVSGTVTSSGREAVSAVGAYWSTNPNPTSGDNVVPGTLDGTAISVDLTGLPDNDTIYWRIFATNLSGTGTGGESTFDTLDDPPPNVSSIRFAEDNTRIRVAFSEAVTGTTGFSVDTGTITYVSGSGTSSYLFSFTGSPTTVSYTPGNVVDSLSQALGSFSNTTIDPELIATSSDTAVASVAKSVVGSVSGSVTG